MLGATGETYYSVSIMLVSLRDCDLEVDFFKFGIHL